MKVRPIHLALAVIGLAAFAHGRGITGMTTTQPAADKRIIEASALPTGSLQPSATGIQLGLIPWQAAVNQLNATNKAIDSLRAQYLPSLRQLSSLDTQAGAYYSSGMSTPKSIAEARDEVKTSLAPYYSQLGELTKLKKDYQALALTLKPMGY